MSNRNSPEARAKISATLKAYYADPANKPGVAKAGRAGRAKQINELEALRAEVVRLRAENARLRGEA